MRAAASARGAGAGGGHELVVARTIDAPPALVFELWTKPEHLAAWWGPDGYTLPFCQLDLRVGGAFCFGMAGPDGDERWIRGVFREIARPAQLAFTFAWGDAARVTGPETLVSVTFEADGARTRLTLRHACLPSTDAITGHRHGWEPTMERLARYAAALAVGPDARPSL